MRKLIILALVLSFASIAAAETVWSGPLMTFTRDPYVDGTDPANMDQITDAVWITRMTGGGSIWNAVVDPLDTFTPCSGPYPTDTEWAIGDIADYASLYYTPFLQDGWADCYPFYFLNPSPWGVLHLISEDIYIPIKFNYWESGGTGGFQYERGTPGPTAAEGSTWSVVKSLY